MHLVQIGIVCVNTDRENMSSRATHIIFVVATPFVVVPGRNFLIEFMLTVHTY